MDTVIFKAFEHSVTERDNVWQLKKTSASLVLFAVIGLLCASIFWGAAQWLPPLLSHPNDDSTALFAQGICKMLTVVFALAALAPISVLCLKHLRLGWTIDTNARVLRIRKNTIPFDQLAIFRIVSTGAYTNLEALTLAGESRFLLMAPSARAPEMQSMADRLNAPIHHASSAGFSNSVPSSSPLSGPYFAAKVIFGLAVMWLLGGNFFFPNLVIVGIFDHGHNGIPVWSLGLFFAAIGVYVLWQSRKEKKAER